MGFRAAFFLGLVLLLSVGNLCFAARNLLFSGANATLDQTPREQVTTSLQQATNLKSPFTFRLKTYQLRNPAAPSDKKSMAQSEEVDTSQTLQRSGTKSPPELPGERKTAQTAKVLLVQVPKLNLSHPEPGRRGSKVGVKSEQPAAAESVSVRCGEEQVTVAVKKNFLGNGQLVQPDDLTLGGCMAVDAVDHILLFESKLQGCGGTVTMTEMDLIYTYSLMYSPTPVGNTSILRTNPVDVAVQCHFKRRYYVSSDALRPLWKTFTFEVQTEKQLHFSLRLMAEDWQSLRASNVYFVRELMRIEAAVMRGYHVPLRVFVDSCVATLNPDPSSHPRYFFINNHGCLTDSKLTGAQSYFMPRSQEDILHFQLKSFKFKEDERSEFYITCLLKATAVDVPIDSQHKACSFMTEAGRWVASGGDNKVCSCCETSCGGQRRKRSPAAADAAVQFEGTAVLGPILVEDGDAQPKPVRQPYMQDGASTASRSSSALMFGAGDCLHD